jgi:hypothetical protein
MYDVLVLAQGMYDQYQDFSITENTRVTAAIQWIVSRGLVDKSIMYLAAYKLSTDAELAPPLAVVMREAIQEIYPGRVIALTEPGNFTTKGEVGKFLTASQHQPVIVSGRYHIPRLFFYLWEARGFRYATQVIYVADTKDRGDLKLWLTEALKILVILLPISLQSKLEEWHARRSHKAVV